MNKGFTLVELLVVIVVMGIITTLVWPTVDRLIVGSDQKKYKTYENSMVAAAKIYVNTFEEDLFPDEDYLTPTQKNNGCCVEFTLNDLIEHGYIKKYDYNGVTCSENSKIKVLRKGVKYSYDYELKCGTADGLSSNNFVHHKPFAGTFTCNSSNLCQ